MNPYLTSQDEAKLIKAVIIKYNHMGVKCAIQHVWSVKGKHNVCHTAHLVGRGLNFWPYTVHVQYNITYIASTK